MDNQIQEYKSNLYDSNTVSLKAYLCHSINFLIQISNAGLQHFKMNRIVDMAKNCTISYNC